MIFNKFSGFSLILLIAAILSPDAIAKGGKQADEDSTASTQERVDIYLPQKIKLGKGLDEYSVQKAESGIQLALSMSGKAVLYPGQMLDSVIQRYQDADNPPNAFDLASEIGAHHVLFANISRIEQILRVNLVAISLDSLSEGFTMEEALATAHKGEGFAHINYWKESGEPMLDPSLVTASQRAFARLMKDSTLYADSQEPYRVFPWPNLAISGVKFVDDPALPIKLPIFEEKLISSFAASQSIFDEVTENGEFVVWDIATRDTIMTLEGFYGVENYNLASEKELSTLWRAGVENVIYGVVTREPKNLILKLSLARLLPEGDFEIINTAEHTFMGDEIGDLIPETKAATRKLLGLKTSLKEEEQEEEK